MNQTPDLSKIDQDLVVSMNYSLTVDGEIVDSTEDNDPIEFIIGQGNIIPGLEKELYGMKVGEKKNVFVPAAEGYGIYDPEALMTVNRSEFPSDIPMEPGTEITVQDEDGEVTVAIIETFDDETVTLNGNHPLAGKDLNFEVEITGVREPTAEELEHGHVHSEDEQDCDCDDEECGCNHLN